MDHKPTRTSQICEANLYRSANETNDNFAQPTPPTKVPSPVISTNTH